MVNEPSSNSVFKSALERLVDGNSDALHALLSKSPAAYAPAVFGLLGVLVRERFGTVPVRSELVVYARTTHSALRAGEGPPLWVIESALRSCSGELSLADQVHSESLYEAVGLLTRSLLGDMQLDAESRPRLVSKLTEVVQFSLSLNQ